MILFYVKLISDLSWNYIGETGALLLLESLKNNDNVLELNIQCNSVSLKTSTMIGTKTHLKLYILE